MVFGVIDAFANGVSPPRAGALIIELNPVKLLVQPSKAAAVGTFTAPRPGLYQFALQGGGGRGATSGTAPGGPGGLAIRTVRLAGGQAVTYAVSGGFFAETTTSSVTFTDGTMSVTPGTQGSEIDDGGGGFIQVPGVGGAATGGDVNVDGAASTTQAASSGVFTGGVRSGDNGDPGGAPGAPGRGGGNSIGHRGAPGRLTVTFVSP
jgi:hypothetical protein